MARGRRPCDGVDGPPEPTEQCKRVHCCRKKVQFAAKQSVEREAGHGDIEGKLRDEGGQRGSREGDVAFATGVAAPVREELVLRACFELSSKKLSLSSSSFVTNKLIELSFVLSANCFVIFCLLHLKFGRSFHTPITPCGRV